MVFGEGLGEETGFVLEIREVATHHKALQGFDGRLLDLGAVPNSEDERAPFETGVCPQDCDGAGVVWREMAGIRTGHPEADRRVPQVNNFEGDDLVLLHAVSD